MTLIPENDVTSAFKILYDGTFISIMKIFINHCSPIVSWETFGSVDQIEENRETLDLQLNYETIIAILHRNSNGMPRTKYNYTERRNRGFNTHRLVHAFQLFGSLSKLL